MSIVLQTVLQDLRLAQIAIEATDLPHVGPAHHLNMRQIRTRLHLELIDLEAALHVVALEVLPIGEDTKRVNTVLGQDLRHSDLTLLEEKLLPDHLQEHVGILDLRPPELDHLHQ
ncbi:MAG: hypothetical protein Q9220_003037 [cf. Caloplaca sp. 1 TL-2023]